MTRFLLIVLLSIPLAFGCAKVSPNAVDLTVDFSWDNVERCSNTSPEIKVSGVPSGTESFQVKLKDLDVPDWNHGGGTVANDGSGVIKEGQLKSGYNGPCPPSGSHRYQFTVNAIDTEGVIVGMGKTQRKFPPE